jgi:hypothetical protein
MTEHKITFAEWRAIGRPVPEGPTMPDQRLDLPGTGTWVTIAQEVHLHEGSPSWCWSVSHGGRRTTGGTWGRCNAQEASQVAASAAAWQSDLDGRRSAQVARIEAERAAQVTR